MKVLGSPDLSFLRFLCLEEMNATITTILHALSPLLVLLVTVVDLILLLRSQISEGLENTIIRICFTTPKKRQALSLRCSRVSEWECWEATGTGVRPQGKWKSQGCSMHRV